MDAVLFVLQLIAISLVIYFLSGRLIGPNVNFFKRILSVVLSITLTTFIFWYSYLRGTDFTTQDVVTNVMNVSTLIWIGSMLLISMLLYLCFELFDPIEFDENGERMTEKKSLIKKLITYWRRQKRLRQVLSIAMKNGITRTMKYARHRDNDRELAIALRDTLEQSGGIFIKFGQVLSTRKELFSPVFIDELEKLQQNVRPLTNKQVQEILSTHLQAPVDELFSFFNEKPLASASIGQVHKAVLRKTNEQVVVKLLRPDVKEMMRADLSILVEFANWVSSKSHWAENLGFRELAVAFANGLREEIDFNIEARNLMQVSNMMQKSVLKVQVPRVYTEYSNANIIVLEFIDGVSVADTTAGLDYLAIDREEFAQTLLYSFLEQVLVSGIFHADPHPGNIYISSKSKKVTLLDFGAVGRLGVHQQEGLKQFFLGISHGNPDMVVDGILLLVENGADIDRAEIEQDISDALLKISYVKHVPSDELIYSLFSIVREHGLRFYPSVSMALRSFVTLDGTLKIIDPGFEIFEEAKVFSSNYVKSSLKQPFKEPAVAFDRFEEELAMLIPTVRRIPRRMDQLFKKLESGKIILHHDIFSDRHNAMFIKRLFSQFILLLVGITFGIISVALLAISQFMHSAYAIYLNTVAYLGLFLCAILLVRLSIQAIRDMKKS